MTKTICDACGTELKGSWYWRDDRDYCDRCYWIVVARDRNVKESADRSALDTAL